MAKFTKKLNGDNRYSVSLTINETSTDITNNTSTISYTLTATKSSGSGYYTSSKTNPIKVIIDGVTIVDKDVSYDFTGSTPKTITLASGTEIIEHNIDGSKTIQCSGYFKDNENSLGSGTASGSVVLSDLNRGVIPTFSENPATLGEQIIITHTRPSVAYKSYYFVFRIIIDGIVRTTITSTNSDSTSWTIPINYAQYFTNSNLGSCTVECDTHEVSGLPASDIIIGTRAVTLGLILPNTLLPSASIGTLLETNATMISKNWPIFVQNKSQIKIPVTATGIYNSTISNVIIKVNGVITTVVYDSNNNIWYTIIDAINSGLNTIEVIAIDSRGNEGTASDSFDVIAYSNPSISGSDILRCLSDGTLDDNGTYLRYIFSGTISPITDANNIDYNTASWKISYKKTTDAIYTDVNISSNYTYQTGNNNVNYDISTFTISADYEYNIKITGTDEFSTAKYELIIDSGFDLLNFNESGKSMAIGQISKALSNEKKLEIALKTEFKEEVDATNINATNINSDNINTDSLLIGNNHIITIETYEEYTGATASDTTDTITYNITKNGYTPIGIVGINCDHSRASMIRLFRWYINGNAASVSYRNVGTNPLIANDTSITIYVAYIKS